MLNFSFSIAISLVKINTRSSFLAPLYNYFMSNKGGQGTLFCPWDCLKEKRMFSSDPKDLFIVYDNNKVDRYLNLFSVAINLMNFKEKAT